MAPSFATVEEAVGKPLKVRLPLNGRDLSFSCCVSPPGSQDGDPLEGCRRRYSVACLRDDACRGVCAGSTFQELLCHLHVQQRRLLHNFYLHAGASARRNGVDDKELLLLRDGSHVPPSRAAMDVATGHAHSRLSSRRSLTPSGMAWKTQLISAVDAASAASARKVLNSFSRYEAPPVKELRLPSLNHCVLFTHDRAMSGSITLVGHWLILLAFRTLMWQ